MTGNRETAARRARWAVAAMFAANGLTMGAWAPQIPLILPRLGITETMLGLLILGLGVGAVGAMLFSGRLIACYGSRSVLRGFALSVIPILPAVVFSHSLPLTALTMALFGAMAGCMDVAMNAQAVAIERRLGRAIMSSSHGFWSLGGFVGGSAGAWVIAHLGAEGQALLASAGAAALVFGAMPFLLPDPPARRNAAAPQRRGHLIPRDAGLWLLGAMALFSMVPEGAVLDWAALYLAKELGADLFRSGLGFAFFAGTMAVMRFAGDGLRSRFGAVQTLRFSGLIGAAGLLGGALAPVDVLAIASFALAGFGVANMVPILFSAAGNHVGLPPGQAISTVTMVGYAGILIAPASIGWVAEHAGFRLTYGAVAILLLVVAALAGRVAAADRLHAPAQTSPAT